MDKSDDAVRVGWRGTDGIYDEAGAGTSGGEITFSGFLPPRLRLYLPLLLKLPSRRMIAPTSLYLVTAVAAMNCDSSFIANMLLVSPCHI